jgi:hypothetical protein
MVRQTTTSLMITMQDPTNEYVFALDVAARGYVEWPMDDDRVAIVVSQAVGWSHERARWFLSINTQKILDLIADLAAQLQEEQ